MAGASLKSWFNGVSLTQKHHHEKEHLKPNLSETVTELTGKPQMLKYDTNVPKSRSLKHLSQLAIMVISHSAKVLGTTMETLQNEFNNIATTPSVERTPKTYAHAFLEYCCFQAFAVLMKHEDCLFDKDVRRFIFDCMVAWEEPTSKPPNIKDKGYELQAKEDEDEDASLFFSDLMPILVDVQSTVGIDAFTRFAPCITILADVITAHPHFETLTAETSGRIPSPLYDKYINALGKTIEGAKARNNCAFLRVLPLSHGEHVIEIDGIYQTVIQHVGTKSFSGRLTLTDHALYFEPSAIVSYRDPIKLNLSSDLDHQVFEDLSGPWGSRLFDKAITYKTSSLPEPVVFEFPEMMASTRRDYWLALIQEVINVHKFIREHHLDDVCKEEALARTLLGTIRLQGIRKIMQALPPNPGALLTFSLAQDFLSKGDLVLKALADTLKDAVARLTVSEGVEISGDEHRTRQGVKVSLYEGNASISIPNSAIETLYRLGLWRYEHKNRVPLVVYKMKPGELTLLEIAIQQSREASRQLQKAKEMEEEVKLEGIGANVAILNELLRPVITCSQWIREVISWKRPLETLNVFLILSYIIYRDWLGYLIFCLLFMAGLSVFWLRITKRGDRHKEILVSNPAGGINMQQAVTIQRAVSQIQGVLQAINITLLKIYALMLSAQPEVSNIFAAALIGFAITLSLLPFKVVAFAIHMGIFLSALKNKTIKENKLERRLRELWHSIPPLSVRMVELIEEKQIQEALQT